MLRPSRILRFGLYALCALAPAAYVTASEELPRKPQTSLRFAPLPGGFGASYWPNVKLRTHEGKEVLFYDDLLKDKVVLINFMYARCEGICPGTTVNLRKVQKLLGASVGRDVFMYSLTLKPEEDTPEVLRVYAEAHGVQPGWLFLTGDPDDLGLLRRKLGFVDPNPEIDASKSSHIGMVMYGNVSQQQWAACPCLSNPRVMLEQLLWMFPEGKRPDLGIEPVAPTQVSLLPEAQP